MWIKTHGTGQSLPMILGSRSNDHVYSSLCSNNFPSIIVDVVCTMPYPIVDNYTKGERLFDVRAVTVHSSYQSAQPSMSYSLPVNNVTFKDMVSFKEDR